jgi:glucose-1-phosphate thymidylyltransferase
LKAIIPVAGVGTRLRPHTYTQPKPLIAVAGKPIIAITIERLLAAGIDDFVFVIGYLGEKIRDFVTENYPTLQAIFIEQSVREGLGHAIWTAREVLKNEKEIIIVLGDIIFQADLKLFLEQPNSCLGVKKVQNPCEVGIVELDKEGFITAAVEKPRIPKSNQAIVGIYKINEVNALLKALEENIKNNIRTHGEFQLTDGITRLVEQGIKISTLTIDNWFDCGKKEILLETNALLLEKSSYASVDLPAYDNTIIIHPVSIAEDCIIQNSIIGPHVTIGKSTTINSAIIKDSIIGSFATIEEVTLHHSIIGSDTMVRGLRQSLNLGDNTEVDFR